MTDGHEAPESRLSELLGVPPAEVAAALEGMVGDQVDVSSVRLLTVPYVSGSPATGGLHRVTGQTRGGRPWSLFLKLLQHPRHWPVLASLPPEFAAAFVADFPWRDELRLWDPLIQTSLPDGLRSPSLHAVVELSDDRVALWTEDVKQDPAARWDLARFGRAAHLLGRWNARSTGADVLAISPYPPGHGLRMYAERSVPARGLAPLADDALWRHPWLSPHGDLRRRLLDLSVEIPAFLDALDDLPQCLPHGDASPQNLLVPRSDPTEPAELVAIDVSFGTPHAVGFDLGQLSVGLIHAGELPASELAGIAEVIVPAYVEGAAAEGLDLDSDTVSSGFALSALLRSGFDAFRLDLLDRAPDDEAAATAFAERIVLAGTLAGLVTDLG